MKPLTRKQAELLAYMKAQERCPSYEEMKNALGLKSKSGVHRLIDALQERGFVRRLPNRARAIEIMPEPTELRSASTDMLIAELQSRGFFRDLIQRQA